MVIDRTLTDLVTVCLAQPDSRTSFAILADYLEEQGDERCKLLRTYLDLWTRAETLPTIKPWRHKGDLITDMAGNERRLRRYACLCVRLMPLPDGRRAWDLLPVGQARQTIVLAELYAAELIPLGQLQSTRIPNLSARGQWITLAAWHAAWAKPAAGPEEQVDLVTDCLEQAIVATTAVPGGERELKERLRAWQLQLMDLCRKASTS